MAAYVSHTESRTMKNWLNRHSNSRIRRLNQRQRKKYHLAEFVELGFHLTLRFKQLLSESELESWINAICDEAERTHLIVGGFSSGMTALETDGFVVAEHGSVSDTQRDAFATFLRQHPLVAEVDAGELVDSWYGQL